MDFLNVVIPDFTLTETSVFADGGSVTIHFKAETAEPIHGQSEFVADLLLPMDLYEQSTPRSREAMVRERAVLDLKELQHVGEWR